MAAYYNEFDPFAAAWLRNLIAAGHIASGDVDERSIAEVSPDDLKGYTQCHFFAGIGGWSYALRLAGWDDARPVWTGSCPCQPFSNAGNKAAQSDERHLWPDWMRLIREQRPTKIFGEQVAGAISRGWLDDAATDLEAEKYSFAAAVLPAYAVQAHHRRDRLFFVADASIKNVGSSVNSESSGQASEFGICFQPSNDYDADEFGARWPLPPSEIPLLVDGYSGLMDEYVAIGNSIVPQVAAEFIKAAR